MSDASSTGEVAGILAGVAAILFGIGRGIQWLMSWGEQRAESRAAKLEVWHNELKSREAAFDKRLDEELGDLRKRDDTRANENMALRMAFELVASALRAVDPHNTALSRAEQILQIAFPLAPVVPPDMTTHLQMIETRGRAADAVARRTEVG